MKPSPKPMGLILAVALVTSAAARSACAATPAQIDDAIKKSITRIYAQQQPNGTWETVPAEDPKALHDSPEGGQWGGLTAISTFALLSAGESAKDPKLEKAIQFLLHAKLRGTYAIAMRAQVWPLLSPSKEVHDAARLDAKLLMDGVKDKADARGMWFYHVDEPKDDRGDHSASQLAVLGIWACTEAGVEVPDKFWQLEDTIWRQHQMADGSWSYVYHDPGGWGKPFLSMTAAGLATLFITQDKVNDAKRFGCIGNPRDPNIDKGLDWVSREFPKDLASPTPTTFWPGPGRPMYLLFALQRLGLASGYRYFGKIDWFQSGADYLIKVQGPDGAWGATPWETAFGLLFLERGRAPIAFNKLNYNTAAADKPQAPWNQRPRDLANLTWWIGKQLEHRVNWQIVDLDTDPVDWLDAPVLYLSGNDELKFTDEQKAKLRAYVEDGGLIVGNPDCASEKFAASFRKLGQSLFDAYEFRELPAAHPIYTRQQFQREKWKRPVSLLSLSNGVRELVILLPPSADAGKSWQMQSSQTRPEAFEVASDIMQYTSGLRALQYRGDPIFVKADPAIGATRTVKVARLKYASNWDPEPGGWRRLAGLVHNTQRVELAVSPVDLATGKLDASYQFAHLTGTSTFTLTPAARSAIKAYVDGGGTLIVDSAGGNGEFATSVETELKAIFPDGALSRIESSSPLLATPADLHKAAYRKFATRIMGAGSEPRLQGMQRNGRLAVICSSMDLSAGLVGTEVDGVDGYAPAYATALMTNILLQQPGATTAPSTQATTAPAAAAAPAPAN